MATKSVRVEARLSPDQRNRIERASAFAGESLSTFIISAAVDRADDLIASQAATTVPADYFDRLLSALDEPAQGSPRLEAAVECSRRRPRIATR